MSELQPLIDLVKAHAPWVLTMLTMIGGARMVLKPFNKMLQDKLTAMMAAAAVSPDAEERNDWESVLHNRWYRILTFCLDLVCSVKLPVLADFLRLQTRAPVGLGNAEKK